MKVKVDNIVSEIYQEIKKSNVIQLKIVTEDLKEWANRKCSKKFLDALIKKLNVVLADNIYGVNSYYETAYDHNIDNDVIFVSDNEAIDARKEPVILAQENYTSQNGLKMTRSYYTHVNSRNVQ